MTDLNEFVRINEMVLQSRLEAVRSVLSHPGEKGRSLERDVEAILRQALPAEYGLSTGFIAYLDANGKPALTEQLDVIIYDAVRLGPLARLGACEVFPIEAVFGYVEVKASLRSDSNTAEDRSSTSVESCLEQNNRLRSHKTRNFWIPEDGTQTKAVFKSLSWNSIRGYVIAFEAKGTVASDPPALAQRMATYSSKLGKGTHLHGLLVVGKAFFKTRPVEASVDTQNRP